MNIDNIYIIDFIVNKFIFYTGKRLFLEIMYYK